MAAENEIAERYRRVAAGLTERVRAVPDDAWERPAPCDGWVARDVVGHLVEWVPQFFEAAGGPALAPRSSAAQDPVAAWTALDAAIQAALDDPATAAAEVSHPHAGAHRFDDAIATFVLPDVLVHTWDLARATGLDERLDAEVVHDLLIGMAPAEEAMRSSGHYGAKVAVPDDADEQTRLIAFTGRQP